MLADNQIHKAIQRIVSAAQPSRIILFGSYGRGEANEDSDLDLLVVEPEVLDKGCEMARLRAAVGCIGVGVDVLVFSEAEVERKCDWCTSPIYWALREGKVLYEAEH